MHSIENEHLKIQVSEHGAELQSIFHKKNQREYLWQGSNECWNRKSPVLFPIVGKLANNTYYVKGREYHLTQHGFARDMEFELVEKREDKLKFVLKANEKTMCFYPFDFKLSISYLLEENRVSVKYKVYNHSTELMYFSIGGHPAFNTDLSENGIEDYYLDFYDHMSLKTKVVDEEVGLLTRDEELVLDNHNLLDLNYDLFNHDTLIFEGINRVSLKNKLNDQEVNLSCEGFPLLGIWTSKTAKHCPFICLEPWYGVADFVGSPKELIDKEYIQSLYPDDKFKAVYKIEIK
jgi:galactose mutarotase-like enzyme